MPHPSELNKQTSFNVIDSLQGKSLEEIKAEAQERMLPYAVALANINGDLNTGNIIRTAACFSAEKVFVFGRRKWDRRSAVGSNHYVEVEAFHNETEPFDWDSAIQTIRVNGYTPVLVEQSGEYLEHISFKDYLSLTEKPCLVFGSESEGIPPAICESEITISIYQPGVLRSLNVASAAAIMIHNLSKFVHARDLYGY